MTFKYFLITEYVHSKIKMIQHILEINPHLIDVIDTCN